jgi:D-glycerate 3-kinase
LPEKETLRAKPADILRRIQREEQLPDQWLDDALLWITKLASHLYSLHEQQAKPLCIGINGSQGSGKTTLSLALNVLLTESFGLRCQTLSIDDFYLSQTARETLSQQVHPLLRTRGVPGTHDCAAAIHTIQQLKQGFSCPIPRFDKATDNPLPEQDWLPGVANADFILLEGWCVGIPPQAVNELETAVNTLEQDEDPDGIWRHFVHQQLAGPYQTLFAELDYLIFLQAPEFQCVYQWRLEQEQKLAARTRHRDHNAIMNEAQIKRFIAHYQRLTEHALRRLPTLTNIVIPLDQNHRLTDCRINQAQQIGLNLPQQKRDVAT